MAIPTYLAMTAAEFASAHPLPDHIAWMACHFSPYGSGLSNLPTSLPPESLLILNDRIPIRNHDPHRIALQLQETVDAMDCSGVLLDFQQADIKETGKLAGHLISVLSCPVAVSDIYAKSLDCPVFLSPCPHHIPVSEYILPWKGRELWLDLAPNFEAITLTKERAQIIPLPFGEIPEKGHTDKLLRCHYSIETGPDSARFTLWRTKEDLQSLTEEVKTLGIKNIIALYQDFSDQEDC